MCLYIFKLKNNSLPLNRPLFAGQRQVLIELWETLPNVKLDWFLYFLYRSAASAIDLFICFRELSHVCFKKWSVIILLAFQWNSWLSITLSCYNNLQSSINSQLISHSSFKLSDRGKRVSKSSDREVLTSKQPMTVELTNQNGIRAPSLSPFRYIFVFYDK